MGVGTSGGARPSDDTELPAAAVPTDGDSNSAVPGVGARARLWDASLNAGSGGWVNWPGTAAAGAKVDTELPAAAALSDADANPTTPAVGSYCMVWKADSAQWQRARYPHADASTFALLGSAPTVYNGASWDRLRAGSGATLTLGTMAVALHSASGTTPNQRPVRDIDNFADGFSNGAASVQVVGYNGSTWDRDRHNTSASALASAARTATTSSADITTYNARTALAILNLSAFTTAASLVLTIEGKDSISSGYYALNAAPVAVTATGLTVYEIGPGAVATGGVTQRTQAALPRTIRVTVTHANANSHTYSVSLVLGV